MSAHGLRWLTQAIREEYPEATFHDTAAAFAGTPPYRLPITELTVTHLQLPVSADIGAGVPLMISYNADTQLRFSLQATGLESIDKEIAARLERILKRTREIARYAVLLHTQETTEPI